MPLDLQVAGIDALSLPSQVRRLQTSNNIFAVDLYFWTVFLEIYAFVLMSYFCVFRHDLRDWTLLGTWL